MPAPRRLVQRLTSCISYVDSQLRNSKRFDAEGIKRDHPRLFEPVPRQHSRRPSTFSGAPGKEADAAGPSSSSSSVDGSWSGSSGKEEGQLRYWTSDMCSRTPHLFDFVVTASLRRCSCPRQR
jgi:NAD+ kinase